MNATMTTEFHAENIKAMQKLSSLHVSVQNYPSDVIAAAKKALKRVTERLGEENADFKKVYEDAAAYLALSKEWDAVGLKNFLEVR